MNSKFTLVVTASIAVVFFLVVLVGFNSEPQLDFAGLDSISSFELLVTGEDFSLEPDGTVAKLEKQPASWADLVQKADLHLDSDVWIYPDKKGVISI